MTCCTHFPTKETLANFANRLHVCLNTASFTTFDGQTLSTDDGIEVWHAEGEKLRKRTGCLYLVGNGASASMSSHFAADLNKNAKIRTQVFTDAALITAVANDISYEQVFAEPLQRMAESRDMLLTISSSGNSPNILAAITVAREKRMSVVTLSGMNANNASRKLGDLNIYVNDMTYGMVETVHSALLHYWTDLLVASATL